MTRRPTEAERMARANEEMRFAMANNCTVLEARVRLNRRRYQQMLDDQAAQSERVRRCGTGSASATDRAGAGQPASTERPAPRFWWMDR